MGQEIHDLNGNLVSFGPMDPYDLDYDGYVNADDVAVWDGCRTEANVPLADDATACLRADFDEDGDVDLADFAVLQPYVFGATVPTPEVDGPAGNITYDDRNRMVRFVDVTTGQQHEYRYDPLNRRIEKTIDVNGSPVTTRYVYDGWRVIEERDASATVTVTYVYGPYIDEPVSYQVGAVNYYVHADEQYNVVAVTNASGVVIERYDYGDYGQPFIYDGAGSSITATAVGNVYLFTGRRYDAEIGWYHYRTRYLNPLTGRFTTRDTIGIWGDPINLGNGYTYAGNNPWTGVDPYGEWLDSVADLASLADNLVDYGESLVNQVKFIAGVEGVSYGDCRKANKQMCFSGLGAIADTAGLLAPGVTGGGRAIRAIEHGDEVVDVGRRVVAGTDNLYDAAHQADNATDAIRALDSADGACDAARAADTAASKNVRVINKKLAGQRHPKTGVPFDKDGFPDFSEVAEKTVSIPQSGNRYVDEAAANAKAGFDKTPDGFTWHHHPDGSTMQLVPAITHQQTAHTGGVALHGEP